MWQALRSELHSCGLEIVTVALDTGGLPAVLPWIEAAQPEHPSLLDHGHVVDALFGIVNVPSGVWIDEAGVIVRPPETAYPRRPDFLDRPVPTDATPKQVEQITAVKQLRIDAEGYVAALRDWVAHGAASHYALTPDDVIVRSRPRPIEEAMAVAHFELGQHLHLTGDPDVAIQHFREASRLQPDNWTYMRQAWNLLPSEMSSVEVYGTDWLTEVQKIGAENYYPALKLDNDSECYVE